MYSSYPGCSYEDTIITIPVISLQISCIYAWPVTIHRKFDLLLWMFAKNKLFVEFTIPVISFQICCIYIHVYAWPVTIRQQMYLLSWMFAKNQLFVEFTIPVISFQICCIYAWPVTIRQKMYLLLWMFAKNELFVEITIPVISFQICCKYMYDQSQFNENAFIVVNVCKKNNCLWKLYKKIWQCSWNGKIGCIFLKGRFLFVCLKS